MKIGIMSNYYKDPSGSMLERVCRFLKERACVLKVERQMPDESNEDVDRRTDFKDIDLMISMGGDGTFLNAVHALKSKQVPIVGINLGSVGFLTEIRPSDLENGLERVLAGDYFIEERMLLMITCKDAEGKEKYQAFALNEALLSRGASQRIIPVELFFDGRYIETIRCDGLLVATPTGSTGYAMAAGGPIVHPDLELLSITPICPYSLHNRSYLLNPDTTVSLSLDHYPAVASLSADGRTDMDFVYGDRVTISMSDQKLKRICLHEKHFFEDLPDKLRGRAGKSALSSKL